MIERIEVEFAIPVQLSDDQVRRLSDLVQDIAKSNEPEGHVHWLFGQGSKPLWSDADRAAFPGVRGGSSGKSTGEPEFDSSVLHLATSCRER